MSKCVILFILENSGDYVAMGNVCGGTCMKLIGITAYGISVKEEQQDLELHNLNGISLLE